MKRLSIFSLLLLLAVVCFAGNDFFLLAENFFLKKGDKLNVRLYNKLQAGTFEEYESPLSKTSKFTIYEGSKKAEIPAIVTDTTVSIAPREMQNAGLAMLTLSQPAAFNDIDKDVYAKHLEDETQTEAAKKIKDNTVGMLREKYTRSMKTLVMVEKNSGNVYEKPVGEEYEIVLQNNPYKANYGDDITGVVYYKGKPMASAQVMLNIKTAKAVHAEKLLTDAAGLFYFKLSREGIYIIRSLHTEASTSKDADFETWWASFTFAFSSANELPNTYKEFGFGEMH